MVGQRNAKEQIAAAMSRTIQESGRWVERATGTIWYLSKHEGEPTIGGGPAIAVRHREGVLHWPFVIVDGHVPTGNPDRCSASSLRAGEARTWPFWSPGTIPRPPPLKRRRADRFRDQPVCLEVPIL
jgi:hypothetical protein